MKWIREGMDLIIPPNIVQILQWNSTEDRVCGMREVDVDKLKGITEYEGCTEDHKVMKMFWAVFTRFSEEDKTLYLRFAWGRSRMPFDCRNLRYKHRLCLVSYWSADALPESHTCFFQTDLPVYVSEEVLEKKLLTSIRFCGDIDND